MFMNLVQRGGNSVKRKGMESRPALTVRHRGDLRRGEDLVNGESCILESMPDLVHAKVVSFLSPPSIDRLAQCAKSFYNDPLFCPTERVLVAPYVHYNRLKCDKQGSKQGSLAPHGVLSSLLTRAGQRPHSVTVVDPWAFGPFCCTLSLESGSYLRELVIGRGPQPFEVIDRHETLLACAMNSEWLPVLEALSIKIPAFYEWAPVWGALGKGACPLLQALEVHFCTSELLADISRAMDRRGTRGGCAEMKKLVLRASMGDDVGDDLGPLLMCTIFRRLEFLDLCTDDAEAAFLDDDGLSAVGDFLSQTGAPALKTLILASPYEAEGASVVRALASGAAPHLEQLCLLNIDVEDTEALIALAEAVKSCGALQHLRRTELSLANHYGFAQLMKAIGLGHGCPDLESMELMARSHGGAVVAPALRGPSLPSLTRLSLEAVELHDLQALDTALKQRKAAGVLKELSLSGACIGRAEAEVLVSLLNAPSMSGLRELGLIEYRMTRLALSKFAHALVTGTGAGLEAMQLSFTNEAVGHIDGLFGALVKGGCPALRSLTLHNGNKVQASLHDLDGLAALLRGDAACSATLERLHMDSIPLHADGLSLLAKALSSSTTATGGGVPCCALRSLELHAQGESLHGPLDLLRALEGHAGRRLKDIWLAVSGMDDKWAEHLGETLAEAVEKGSMPLARRAYVINRDGPPVLLAHTRLHPLLSARIRTDWM